jgi:ribosomal-protein-alanine N-acetyltransferase
MINLISSRMIIRNFTQDDWRDLQKLIIDKEASKYALYDYPFPTGDREAKEITNWFSQHDNFLAVYEMTVKKVIGYIALNGDNVVESGLGYCLHSDYQDKGYATEACIAIINYAFGTLKVNRLTSGTAVLNLPSCKLLARLGFRKVNERVTSFRKTAEGKAIEFTGASFELSKDVWLKTNYHDLLG